MIQSSRQGTKNTAESGGDGFTIENNSSFSWALLLREYLQGKYESFHKFSLKSIGKPGLTPNREKFLASVQNQWREGLSARPQALWLQHSGTVINGTPFTKGTKKKQHSEAIETMCSKEWKIYC